MAGPVATGILVEEIPGREASLDVSAVGATAFVGAAPRGPLNDAVLVESCEEFDREFGLAGIEYPLQRAVRDFFLAGGARAAVVRVANGGRPCAITLPGRDGALTLEALSPGRREFLRASVDYDHIGPSDDLSFNLVVQRLRSPGTEKVIDQEIYQRLSLRPDAEHYVMTALMESRLVKVRGAPPPTRPAATISTAPGYPVTWVEADETGTDGAPLTDYDLIGSSALRSGLFALDGVEPIDFLCLPPGRDGRSPGPTLLLAALRYCRTRRAMLILEPPGDIADGEHALSWLQGLNIAGENAMAVFPRLAGDAREPGRSSLGAVAGALSRRPAEVEPPLGGHARPVHEFSPELRRRLQAAGMNVIARGGSGRIVLEGDRTLASPECPVQAWRSLSARRLAMSIERTLLHGTRWVVFEPPGEDLAQRLRDQLCGWLESMRLAGLLAGEPPEAWFVDVNEIPASARPAQVEFTVGFAARRPREFVIYRVSQGLHGARLVPVSAERWAITQPLHAGGRVVTAKETPRPGGVAIG